MRQEHRRCFCLGEIRRISGNYIHCLICINIKCVNNQQCIRIFNTFPMSPNPFFQEYLGFIFAIGDSIKGKKIRDLNVEELDKQSVVVGIINVLGELDKWVSEIPPVEQQQRFGNKAFREWHKRLEEVSTRIYNSLKYQGTTK